MSFPTMSRMAGWLACPAHEHDTSPAGPGAQFGNRVHEYVERRLSNDEWLTFLTPEQAAEAATANRVIDWLSDNELLVGVRPEVAYEVDPFSVFTRELGSRIGRNYAAHGGKSFRIFGTADIVGPGVVIDIKTGKCSGSHEAQMEALGYAVAKTQDAKSVRLILLYANEQCAVPVEREMDAMDLDAYAITLREAAEREPTPVPGKHCSSTYCGARKTCVAHKEWKRGKETSS